MLLNMNQKNMHEQICVLYGKMNQYSLEYKKHRIKSWEQKLIKQPNSSSLKTLLAIDKKLYQDTVKLLSYVKSFKIDLGGHEYNSLNLNEINNLILYSTKYEFDFDELIKTNRYYKLNHLGFNCSKCGKSNLIPILDKQNKTIFLSENNNSLATCLYKKGVQPYTVEVKIESGKMLMLNDIRPYFDWTLNNHLIKNNEEYSINHHHGQKQFTEKQAELNCASFNISNCACYLFEINNSTFIVGNGYNIETEENMFEKKGYIERANICTDLWGYSIIDKTHFLNKAGKNSLINKTINNNLITWELNDSHQTVFEINCSPGTYKFTHLYDEDKQIYTEIIKT